MAEAQRTTAHLATSYASTCLVQVMLAWRMLKYVLAAVLPLAAMKMKQNIGVFQSTCMADPGRHQPVPMNHRPMASHHCLFDLLASAVQVWMF